MFGRRRPSALPAAPERQPHPDARVEAEFQRILSLRKAVARKEEQLSQNQANIAHIRNMTTRHPGYDGHALRLRQIEALQREIPGLEAEVVRLHDEIAERIAAITDTDLAYL
jgi:predicted  nucleic acid-binding Zn-ribbon protein